MCKIAFSASETTILPTSSYLLRTPVYLMSILCAHMKLPRNANFHLKMLNLANICVYYAFRNDFEWFENMSHITKNALSVAPIWVWLPNQNSRSYHTVSVQISHPQYSMCKIAFPASETTILPTWQYLLRTPVYLMSL